jgi:hypothetical protein
VYEAVPIQRGRYIIDRSSGLVEVSSQLSVLVIVVDLLAPVTTRSYMVEPIGQFDA